MENLAAVHIGSPLDAYLAQSRERITSQLAELIKIDTVAPNEEHAFPLIEKWLDALGMEHYRQEPHPELDTHNDYTPPFVLNNQSPRRNLKARWPHTDKPRLRISIHVDVVPAGKHPQPWSGLVDNERVYGRGSADNKGNIIILLEALRLMKQLDLQSAYDIEIDFVTDEEAGGNGALSCTLYPDTADAVLVMECTDLLPYYGHRGCVTFDVTCSGETGHMGCSHGKGLFDHVFDIVTSLKTLSNELNTQALAMEGYQALGDDARVIQLNINECEAKGWHGTAMEIFRLRCNLGLPPDLNCEEGMKIVEQRLTSAGVDVALTMSGLRNRGYIGKPQGPLLNALTTHSAPALVQQHAPTLWHVSCDARHYEKLNPQEIVIWGVGSLSQAHSNNEYVQIDDMLSGINTLITLLSNHEVRL